MKTNLAMLALVLALAGVCTAHTGQRLIEIFELPTSQLPDVRDGSLDDWDQNLPFASLDHRDFTDRSGNFAAPDPTDLSLRAYLAWHSNTQRLYIGLELLDDSYINQYPGGDPTLIADQDHLLFSIDGDHSGDAFVLVPFEAYTLEEHRLSDFSQVQQYRLIAQSPDGRQLVALGAARGWVDQPPYADAGSFHFDDVPSESIIEFYITPWDALDWQSADRSRPTFLAPDRIVGLDLQFFDYDTAPGLLEDHFGLGVLPFDNALRPIGADLFVDGLLIPCDIEDCSIADISAVELDSWGRVKASFK